MKSVNQKIFFASNIKFLRIRQGLSQEAAAEKLGLTRAKLASIEAGNTKAPQPEDYLNFSNFFAVSIDTLLKVNLPLLGELKLRELESGNDVFIKGGNLRVLAISVDKSNNEHVEYVPIKAKAGYAASYADPEFIASLPKYSLPHLQGGTYRIFPIVGDSMLPIPDGSDVTGSYVEDWTALSAGTPCIVLLKGQQDFVFKLVSWLPEGQFLLSSLNPAYRPYTVAVEEVLEIWRFHAYSTRVFPDGQSDLSMVMAAIKDLERHVRPCTQLRSLD